MNIKEIIAERIFTKENLVFLLESKGEDRQFLFESSARVKKNTISDKVYFRGLIEFSNICKKNCLYCGIRSGRSDLNRYNIDDEEILKAVEFAYQNKYGSVVLQSGERDDIAFVDRIDNLLREIKRISNNEVGVTLSLGEQSKETYQRWFESGAHRYLLRIESSNRELYSKIHPNNELHDFDKRLQALKDLKEVGYQTGTGVMVGLPFQTTEILAEDLLFMQSFDIDMVGMGPYIEHKDTPLYEFRDELLPKEERFDRTLKMIAILRLMMPDINMAATTAMQSIDKLGREKAIKVGANVVMPNITPGQYRDDYFLYDNKPCTDDSAEDCKNCLEARIAITDHEIGYGEWGDSKHFYSRKKD